MEMEKVRAVIESISKHSPASATKEKAIALILAFEPELFGRVYREASSGMTKQEHFAMEAAIWQAIFQDVREDGVLLFSVLRAAGVEEEHAYKRVVLGARIVEMRESESQ